MTTLQHVDQFLELKQQLREDVKQMIKELDAELEKTRIHVRIVANIYCLLKILDAADGIDLSKYIETELQQKIEELLSLFGLKCEVYV